MKTLSISAAAARGLILALALSAVATRAPAQESVAEAQAALTIDQVMGPDDGFGISLQASGDFMASMEPCGCKIPMGGIGWRASYAKAIESKAPGAAVVQVDAGNIFRSAYPDGYAHIDDLAIKNEWVLKACDLVHMSAANVTVADLAFLSTLTATDEYAARSAEFPALASFVSANIVPADEKHHAFKPYVIKEITAPRFGAAPVRIGVLGVAEVPKRAQAALFGYAVTDPMAAIRKYAPEVRAKCDILVILAYVDKPSIAKIEPAAGVAVDAIIAAHNFPLQVLDKTVEAPVYTYPPTEAKAISEIRFYPPGGDTKARFGKVVSRYVALTDAIPSDPVATKFMWDAAKAYRKS